MTVAEVIGYIATLIGIVGAFAKVIMDYAKLKSIVEELIPLKDIVEKLKVSDANQEANLQTLKARTDEDRANAQKNYDRFFTAQQEMSSVLKEVTTILNQLDKSMESRLSRLEQKIDSMTTLRAGD